MTNEQEHSQTSAAPRGPRSFIVRHWIALLCIVVVVVLLVVFIRYIHGKQPVAAPGRGGRGGQNGPVAIGAATAVNGNIDVNHAGGTYNTPGQHVLDIGCDVIDQAPNLLQLPVLR